MAATKRHNRPSGLLSPSLCSPLQPCINYTMTYSDTSAPRNILSTLWVKPTSQLVDFAATTWLFHRNVNQSLITWQQRHLGESNTWRACWVMAWTDSWHHGSHTGGVRHSSHFSRHRRTSCRATPQPSPRRRHWSPAMGRCMLIWFFSLLSLLSARHKNVHAWKCFLSTLWIILCCHVTTSDLWCYFEQITNWF